MIRELKTVMGITTCILEWLKLKQELTITNAAEEADQQEV